MIRHTWHLSIPLTTIHRPLLLLILHILLILHKCLLNLQKLHLLRMHSRRQPSNGHHQGVGGDAWEAGSAHLLAHLGEVVDELLLVHKVLRRLGLLLGGGRGRPVAGGGELLLLGVWRRFGGGGFLLLL